MDEHQLRVTQADHVAGVQRHVALDQLVAHHGAVAAFQVADHPLFVLAEDLRVMAAAAFVLEHDLIGWGTAQRHRLAGDQPEHVAPLRPLADDEVGDGRHGRFVRRRG